jgi:regulatory protein
MTLQEIKKKLEYYCVYQERCHQEVKQKLYDLGCWGDDADMVIVHLLEHNFLNESRFAQSFSRGKHRIKLWGKIRITIELKNRGISNHNINLGLKEITNNEYWDNFLRCATSHWESINEMNINKKRKKFCDYMLRKGYESTMVYEQLKTFEAED